MPAEPTRYRTGDDASIVAVADDPDLLAAWAGQPDVADLRPLDDDAADAVLGPAPWLLLRTIDEVAVQLVQRLDWSGVHRCSVALLRGLARRPCTLELLEALAEVGLEPTAAQRCQLGVTDGVEVTLTRGGGTGLGALAAAHRIATQGGGLLSVRNEAPRIALAGVDRGWAAGFDNVHDVDPRWAHDATLLREASPTVTLVERAQLSGPTAQLLTTVRAQGGSVVSDQAPPAGADLAPDATLDGLPLPMDPQAFVAHLLYAGEQGARPLGVEEARDPRRLLALAAAGAPVAGLEVTEPLVAALGPQLCDLLGRDPAELDTAAAVDHHQVRVRRAAIDHASPHAVWTAIGQRLGRTLVRSPRVLVVAPAPTEAATARARAAVDRQRHPERELLLGPPGVTVGDVLAHARRVGAELVTLFEPHARYGAEHLADLVRTSRRTGADLLLRPAELHLDDSGRLQRRPVAAVETATRDPDALALAVHADDLAYLDQRAEMHTMTTPALAATLLDLGARAYRTHGLGLLAAEPDAEVAAEEQPDLLAATELREPRR